MADYKAGSGAPPSYPADAQQQYPVDVQQQQQQYPAQPHQQYTGDHIGHAGEAGLQQQPQPAMPQHQDSTFSQEKGVHGAAPGVQSPGGGQQMAAAAAGYQTAMPLGSLGAGAAPVDCPACNMRQMTRIEYKSGGTTWAWAAGVCCLLGCGCIPFCINSTKDVLHFCGHCGASVARWHRSGHTEVLLHR